MCSRGIRVMLLLRVTFVLLVLYFNPMLPLALRKLRGARKQKGDLNSTVCLLPGSGPLPTNSKQLSPFSVV